MSALVIASDSREPPVRAALMDLVAALVGESGADRVPIRCASQRFPFATARCEPIARQARNLQSSVNRGKYDRKFRKNDGRERSGRVGRVSSERYHCDLSNYASVCHVTVRNWTPRNFLSPRASCNPHDAAIVKCTEPRQMRAFRDPLNRLAARGRAVSSGAAAARRSCWRDVSAHA